LGADTTAVDPHPGQKYWPLIERWAQDYANGSRAESKEVAPMAEGRRYRTRVGGYRVRLNSGYPLGCAGFAWLGTIDLGDGHLIGWAWHWDGRSVDPIDGGFDLVDFPQERALAETMAADG
jgi:hypothetical protein